MPVKVKLAARIINNKIVMMKGFGFKGNLAALLTNLTPSNFEPKTSYKLDIEVGDRKITLDLPPLLSSTHYLESLNNPILTFEDNAFANTEMPDYLLQEKSNYWFFKNKIFYTEREYDKNEVEEVIHRIKLHDLQETNEIEILRRKVKNLESAINVKKDIKRAPIPDDVQIFVMARDSGKCVKCGLEEALQYDHIIPLSKGGSNTVENIQILCRLCNQRKSNNIGG